MLRDRRQIDFCSLPAAVAAGSAYATEPGLDSFYAVPKRKLERRRLRLSHACTTAGAVGVA